MPNSDTLFARRSLPNLRKIISCSFMPSSARLRRELFSFFRLIRLPNLFIMALAQVCAALFLARPYGHWTAYLQDAPFLLVILSTGALGAAGYVINDYYDIKIDYVNRPEGVVVGSVFSRRSALLLHWVLNFFGVVLGLIASPYIGLINLAVAVLLWYYSNRLKRMPLLGNLSIGLLTGLTLVVVGIYFGELGLGLLSYAFFASVINVIRELVKDMEDLRGDRIFGCRTLPIVWGLRPTKWLIYAVVLAFVTTAIYTFAQVYNTLLFTYALFLALIMAFFVHRLYWADSQRDFHQLSAFCKLVMLAGILSMVFI
ncbi:MAG: UbiA family prenyltransferase [Cytophagales bacterium]|nr:UbiA family prenyltransferase [Cytophagales bacterium]